MRTGPIQTIPSLSSRMAPGRSVAGLMKWAPFAVGLVIFAVAPVVIGKMPGLAGMQAPGLEGLFSQMAPMAIGEAARPVVAIAAEPTAEPTAHSGAVAQDAAGTSPSLGMMQVWVVLAVAIHGLIGLTLKSGLLWAGRKIDPNLPDPWARIEAKRLRSR